MKALTLLCALCCCLLPFIGKAQFQDDFSDNNLTHNPNWDGEITKFEVLNNQLHLNAPAERSEAHIYTASEANDSLTFSCDIFLGFNPSSSNYSRIEILVDTVNNGNGIWLLVGNADDAVQLYQRKNNTDSLLLEIKQALNSDSVALNIQLNLIDDTLGFRLKDLQTDAVLLHDNIAYSTVFESHIFSINCHYTSTRSKKFYFDNISLNGRKTILKSRVTNAAFIDEQSIQLSLDKPLEQSPEPFWLSLNSIPCDSIQANDSSVMAYWSFPFQNQSIHLLELAENPLIHEIALSIPLFHGKTPTKGQLLVTEVMTDPSPSYGLPEVEFIELFNPTPQTLNLTGIYVNGREIEQNTLLMPFEIIVISREPIPGATKNLVIQSLPKYWLANEKGTIHIENPGFQTIYHLEYSKYWHSSTQHQEGGISLELQQIRPNCFNHSKMWGSSKNQNGGSPGAFIEQSLPWLIPELNWIHERNGWYELSFNNPIYELTQDTAENNWVYVSDRNTVYVSDSASIEILEIIDCSGQELKFTLPKRTASDNQVPAIIFNEVMYDTNGDIPEYIELVNVGKKAVNLSNLSLQINRSSPAIIDTAQRLLLPESFVVLCRDSSGLHAMTRYNDKSVILNDAISLPNSGTLLQLVDNQGLIIDEFEYHSSLHFSGYHSTQNIALERITEAIKAPWTSASAVYGGSPGKRNTQYNTSRTEHGLQISNDLITPNSDGHQDFCSLYFNDLEVNSSVSVYIFDNMGNKVMDLVQDEIPGTNAVYQWSGQNNLGIPVISGIYLLVAKINSVKGEVLFRKSITVLYP